MKKLLLSLFSCSVFALPVSAQPFSYSLMSHELPTSRNGALAMGDYNGDGRMEILILANIDNAPDGRIYQNMGLKTVQDRTGPITVQSFFDTRPGPAMPKMVYSALALADVDLDGDLDFAASGAAAEQAPYNPLSGVYTNKGISLPIEKSAIRIEALYSGALAWGDIDQDGDPDLAQCGLNAEGVATTKIFRNNFPTVSFTDTGFSLEGAGNCALAWGDYDKDGDLDLVISGSTNTGMATKLYRNDQTGFSEVNAGLIPLVHSSVDWGDYDNDGDLDLLVSGGRISPEIMTGVTKLYRNDGGFLTDTKADLNGIFAGRTAWADYDNDGDLDIISIGAQSPLVNAKGRIYQNQSGTFAHTVNVVGMMLGGVALGDLDGDYDADLLVFGFTGEVYSTNYFRNEVLNYNLLPKAPANLQAEVTGTSVKLSWAAGSDFMTPTAGLSYNLRVGTTTGGQNVVNAMANINSGRRLVTGLGNAGQSTTYTLKNLKKGTYYWSVQTLDSGYAASTFSQEGSFTISAAQEVVHPTPTESDELPNDQITLHPNYPNPFAGSTNLRYSLPKAAYVSLRVVDILGKEVRIVQTGYQNAGMNQVQWDAKTADGQPVAAGVYLIELSTGTEKRVQKVVVQ